VPLVLPNNSINPVSRSQSNDHNQRKSPNSLILLSTQLLRTGSPQMHFHKMSTWKQHLSYHTTTTVLRPFFRDHPGEPVPEQNFCILWCNGRLTEADTPTIRLGATPSGLTTAHLHHPPFLQAGCPSCRPTNSVIAVKVTSNISLSHSKFMTFEATVRNASIS